MVKNLPAMQETQVPSLGREDPLEKGMATHSGILAWRMPWTEEPMGSQRVDMTEWPTLSLSHRCVCAEYVSCSVMPDSLQPFWTVACQAPLSMGFSRQEYCMGCHSFLQEIFPSQGSNLQLLCLLLCKQILYLVTHWGNPCICVYIYINL